MNNNDFVSELAKLRPSATFLSLIGYRNESNEVADYSIIFHISYENALKRSLMILESIIPADEFEAQAKQELMDGYYKSINKIAETPIEEVDDVYTYFVNEDGNYIKGIKLHTQTNILHLYGLVNAKRVIIPGQYKHTNKRPLTKAKDKLRKMVPVNRFRQFIIKPSKLEKISVEGLHLLPPNDILI